MIAIITGASRGIGFAIAEQFAAQSYTLLLNASNESRLNQAKEMLQQLFPHADIRCFAADLTDNNAVKEFGKWCLKQGTPDVLVNNAGSYVPGNCVDEADGQLEWMLQVNLMSAYHLTRIIAPAMQQVRNGHIFNMCSIAGLKAYPGGGSYSISKYALSGFTKNIREELKSFSVKVTGIYPGAVLTDSWGDFDNSEHRIMEAKDIAQMVWQCTQLSPGATVEDIVIRPQLGDL